LKKLFSDNLPRYEKGCYKNNINWKESIGYKVKFIYDDIKGEIEIIKYYRDNKNRSYIDIKYNNNIISTTITGLLKCQIGELLNRHTKKYKYKIGEIIEKVKYGKLEILNQIRMQKGGNSTKGYIYKCLICENIDDIYECYLVDNHGCNVCSGRKVLKGYNDLWTTHPNVAKLLKYSEQGHKLSFGSAKSEIFVCPECGYEKPILIFSIVNQGFACPRCSDGVSYSNKFIRSFFSQLNEEYISEYSPDWAFIKQHDNPKLKGKKKYDNILINYKEIWEVHGSQHYEEEFNVFIKKAKTFEEEKENDKIKKDLAIQNNHKYIIIDSRKSEIKWIKNSLINLPEIKRYDLSLIDWLKCHEYACKSLVKTACDYWNNGIKDTTYIGNILKLSRNTIVKYLKQGVELGWCDYNPRQVLINNGKMNGGYNKRKIIQLTLDGEFIKEWNSIIKAKNKLKISAISQCCRGLYKTAGGFKWHYKDEYIENKNIIIHKDNIIAGNKKQIVQLTLNNNFIKEWESVSDASKNLHISRSCISGCCKGNKKYSHTGKFKWMFKKDYEEYIKINT